MSFHLARKTFSLLQRIYLQLYVWESPLFNPKTQDILKYILWGKFIFFFVKAGTVYLPFELLLLLLRNIELGTLYPSPNIKVKSIGWTGHTE